MPPPPSFSMMTCTLMSPMLLAEMFAPPSAVGLTTKLTSTPEILSSSSAAWAIMTRSCGSSGAATAMFPR